MAVSAGQSRAPLWPHSSTIAARAGPAGIFDAAACRSRHTRELVSSGSFEFSQRTKRRGSSTLSPVRKSHVALVALALALPIASAIAVRLDRRRARFDVRPTAPRRERRPPPDERVGVRVGVARARSDPVRSRDRAARSGEGRAREGRLRRGREIPQVRLRARTAATRSRSSRASKRSRASTPRPRPRARSSRRLGAVRTRRRSARTSSFTRASATTRSSSSRRTRPRAAWAVARCASSSAISSSRWASAPTPRCRS